MSRLDFARVGPVHFQPLQMELAQVRHHIAGSTLNAGCGERDISELLMSLGAADVTNYDIQSTIPNAILGSLESTAFESERFDTIFCNAVLEHVPNIEMVMSELTRILKPKGKLIVGMPFLQPFHSCPTDFRRYTREGLVELGQLHGMGLLELFPVHNIAQTLGWITWEWAQEKNRIYRFFLFPIIYLTTRIWYKTDFGVVNNANTFQAVYVKGNLADV